RKLTRLTRSTHRSPWSAAAATGRRNRPEGLLSDEAAPRKNRPVPLHRQLLPQPVCRSPVQLRGREDGPALAGVLQGPGPEGGRPRVFPLKKPARTHGAARGPGPPPGGVAPPRNSSVLKSRGRESPPQAAAGPNSSSLSGRGPDPESVRPTAAQGLRRCER